MKASRRFPLVALCLLTGCASSASVSSLEAEVHRLRAEQERQAAMIEQLQHRGPRAEAPPPSDGARTATISLGTDAPGAEPIRVDATTRGDTETPTEGGDVTAVRVSRGDRIPEGAPFVVHPTERLPVTAVPPPPGSRPAAPTTAPVAPSRPGPQGSLEGVGPALGMSTGVLDPAAVPAYDEALSYARSGRCDEAIARFDAWLARWPSHPHTDNALYWRGQCHLRRGDLDRARRDMEALLSRFPVGNKVPDALFTLASLHRRTGDVASAEQLTQRLVHDFPDSDPARRISGHEVRLP